MPLRQNHGQMPRDAKSKRIRGILRNGMRFGFHDVPDWPADTTRWSIDPPDDFDVAEFEVI